MFPRFVPAAGLIAVLTPAAMGAMAGLAHAQTNIDQGKTPAQIFAEDCAACHKTTRGLAPGKNNLSLSVFLREHYTTSRAQAAALAAYVLGAGGAEAAKPGQKPGQERAKNEEPKSGEPKTAARPGRPPAKPEPEVPASAKLKPSPTEEAKPERQASHPAAGEREAHPVTATRGRKNEPETPAAAPPPAAVVSAPPASETPAAAETPKNESKNEQKVETGSEPRAEPGQDQTPTTSAGAPAQPQSGEGEPVPRDNIPD